MGTRKETERKPKGNRKETERKPKGNRWETDGNRTQTGAENRNRISMTPKHPGKSLKNPKIHPERIAKESLLSAGGYNRNTLLAAMQIGLKGAKDSQGFFYEEVF